LQRTDETKQTPRIFEDVRAFAAPSAGKAWHPRLTAQMADEAPLWRYDSRGELRILIPGGADEDVKTNLTVSGHAARAGERCGFGSPRAAISHNWAVQPAQRCGEFSLDSDRPMKFRQLSTKYSDYRVLSGRRHSSFSNG